MTSKTAKNVVAVVGPTASGKSSLSVELALKFNGEIISADSRQIYRGLDAGSGKITQDEMKGVPHYLLSIANPADPQPVTLAEYLKLAKVAMDDIFSRGKTPFVVGGTGLYVSALVEGYRLPDVEPNFSLRRQLEKYSLAKLQDTYHALDPQGFKKIDINNPRRLIRAIEVVAATKKPFFGEIKKDTPNFRSLVLGLEVPWEDLKKRIHERLYQRYPAMLDETKKLRRRGVSWQRLAEFGLEYKWMARLAQKKVAEQEALLNLEKEIIGYARRQLTWWRKKPVIWVKNSQEARSAVRRFLTVKK